MWDFPVRFLAEFFANHGMLGFRDRPQWQTVVGGSQRYVQALSAPFADRVRLRSPVLAVRREDDGVSIRAASSDAAERFDEVIFACHADQALAALEDPSPLERELLGAFAYASNEAVLHTDARLLPRRHAARQAWNFHLFATPQQLNCAEDYCVSLNMTDRIDPSTVIATIAYEHPIFTRASVAAAARLGEISPANRTRYAGAHWGWGFHEDGVVSALRAVEGL
jgi:predicted NAD/FAD-binding protein